MDHKRPSDPGPQIGSHSAESALIAPKAPTTRVDGAAERQATEEFFDETCDRCGQSVAVGIGSYWVTDDDLWHRVVGNISPPPILCPHCFTTLAGLAGASIGWVAKVDPTKDAQMAESSPPRPVRTLDEVLDRFGYTREEM